jgi:hypothetical protein
VALSTPRIAFHSGLQKQTATTPDYHIVDKTLVQANDSSKQDEVVSDLWRASNSSLVETWGYLPSSLRDGSIALKV